MNTCLEGEPNAQPLAPGFIGSGVAAGIKVNGKLDLALIYSEAACRAAGVFTSNLVKSAAVKISQSHLSESASFHGVVLTSGNANAATGSEGLEGARLLCRTFAEVQNCQSTQVLICQTGLIGKPFPAAIGAAGVRKAARELCASGGISAARAMMTTDTKLKIASVKTPEFSVCAMAKGAAMLAPSMATMLVVLTTDANADRALLRESLSEAMDSSFHAMVVDGCRSTNDSVIVLANGLSAAPITGAVCFNFKEAVRLVCESLARQMAADAEGGTKLLVMKVSGGRTLTDARLAARGVVSSALVKCSLAGESCYFGRVISELGASGAVFNPDNVSIRYGATLICRNGVAHPYDEGLMAQYLKNRTIEISADLGAGSAEATAYGCDLTHGYVDENMGKS